MPVLPVPVHASVAKRKKRRLDAAARQSLCAEMASELRFAVRCGSRQRPAAKARNSDAAVPCDRCSPRATRRRTRYCSTGHEETTYIPSIEIPRLNGVSLVPHDGLVTMASLPTFLSPSFHILLLFEKVVYPYIYLFYTYTCITRKRVISLRSILNSSNYKRFCHSREEKPSVERGAVPLSR